tara:strand:+ start:2021 stop:2290 length:270 start_codon:yes stop_codon:yes gene_type:complete
MLHPVNRYLVVKPCASEEKQNETTILVPEDVQIDVAPFKVVELVSAHVESTLQPGSCLVVPSHSLEQVSVEGSSYHVVLENHVVALVGT